MYLVIVLLIINIFSPRLIDATTKLDSSNVINDKKDSVLTGKLSGFVISPYFNEQVCTFNYDPEIRVFINAPAIKKFDILQPTEIIIYALPNGNTIEQTIGKKLNPGDDWHFDIQHIAAQTRFLREHINKKNLVVVYLENTQKSWPLWKKQHNDYSQIINSLVNYLIDLFSEYNPSVVLTGHSGGGSFTFGFLDSVKKIPDVIKRIAFLDSDYGYDNAYGKKILKWLKSSSAHYLCVLAYDDSIALYNGKRVVSDTGGTWYRSKLMIEFLSKYIGLSKEIDNGFIKYTGLNGRVKFFLKKNPERIILHTVQIELNGFIEAMVSGTNLESDGYEYFGERAYSQYIQIGIDNVISSEIR